MLINLEIIMCQINIQAIVKCLGKSWFSKMNAVESIASELGLAMWTVSKN